MPSTVLAAQAAAGAVPDPYYGDNLRQIPGTSYLIGHNFANLPMPADSPYRCGWWYRTEFAASAASAQDERLWLHLAASTIAEKSGSMATALLIPLQVAGAYRTYDFDVTDWIKRGGKNVLAVETFAPTEKDLGINWVDWNPCPPDKDMGLWGAVDLVTTGAVTLHSPMAVTHFEDSGLGTADLTLYAELHNAADISVKGVVSASAVGVRIEQPVELAAHEDRTVVFTPEQFPALRIRNPKVWWPYQMGEPHLEHLTMNFAAQGRQTDEQSVDFGIREVTSEFTADGNRLFRVNGKPILIRGAGWSQDMLLRTDTPGCANNFIWCAICTSIPFDLRASLKRKSSSIWPMSRAF